MSRAAAPMHSHGLTSQPMTDLRVCCRRVDRVRPLVGFSCYAILGEIWVVLLLLAGLEVDSSLPYSMLPGKGESIPLFPTVVIGNPSWFPVGWIPASHRGYDGREAGPLPSRLRVEALQRVIARTDFTRMTTWGTIVLLFPKLRTP